jgi:hypothetical protein
MDKLPGQKTSEWQVYNPFNNKSALDIFRDAFVIFLYTFRIAFYAGYGFSNPCAVNNSSFPKISIVEPSTTTKSSSITIVRGNNSCTSRISCVVIGSWRSKLINVLLARGSSPAEGSSKTKILGFLESAMAMAMRFFPTALRREELGIYRLSHN